MRIPITDAHSHINNYKIVEEGNYLFEEMVNNGAAIQVKSYEYGRTEEVNVIRKGLNYTLGLIG